MAGLFLLGILPFTTQGQMKLIEDFGPNPGELKAFLHLPAQAKGPMPLVVALHGCLQNSEEYARETGWNEMGDKYGFAVLYPEQVASNNPNKCFSWFLEGDINKDEGETQSIKSMIDYLLSSQDIDSSQIYVSGLSAGGCMTAVMMATYPSLFKGGAVIAGVPYKATITFEGALLAMQGAVDQAPDQWGKLVHEQNPEYKGAYPNLVIFHGAEDPVVNRKNMEELAEQWQALHKLTAEKAIVESNFDGNPNVTRKSYLDNMKKRKVVTFEVEKLGHAMPVSPGTGPKQGGATGRFSVNAGFYVTYWAAEFFGLIEDK